MCDWSVDVNSVPIHTCMLCACLQCLIAFVLVYGCVYLCMCALHDSCVWKYTYVCSVSFRIWAKGGQNGNM